MPGQNRSLWGAQEAPGAVEGQVVEKGWLGTEVSERAGGSGLEQVIGAEGGRRDPHTHTSLPLRWQGGFVPCFRVDVRGAETCRKLWHGSEPPCTSGEDCPWGLGLIPVGTPLQHGLVWGIVSCPGLLVVSPDGVTGVELGSEVPAAGLKPALSPPPALPAAEACGTAGPSSVPLELRAACEHRGALCAAAGGLGGGEDGQVPPNPRACKEQLFSPSGFSRFLKL